MAQAKLKQLVSDAEIEASVLLTAFEALLQALDAKVQALIDSDIHLTRGCQRLRTITGIGAQGAALLATLLSRLQFANADALVAYCGLDPRANDSGTKRGRRRLSKKGPPLLRRQMYMAGFATSSSKALKPLYRALRAKGFAATEAFVILGRKLLRVAFAIWHGTNRSILRVCCLKPLDENYRTSDRQALKDPLALRSSTTTPKAAPLRQTLARGTFSLGRVKRENTSCETAAPAAVAT